MKILINKGNVEAEVERLKDIGKRIKDKGERIKDKGEKLNNSVPLAQYSGKSFFYLPTQKAIPFGGMGECELCN